ncbi:coiled-coil domain-containing protein 134-like [Coccinella septempunctata]|uniref:coiled-coil domain-containing protein 134-like n=1 Tax=Coccinella septempunctata TaxID=41139 RepID=UPI001D0959C4|nr:coiled-coil domain-containing protein 134-like [Coccinella septempunctata]
MNYIIFFIVCYAHVFAQIPESPQLAEELYKQLFKRQRVNHLEAIKSFRKISHYEKQYSMIQIMAEKVFSNIQEHRAAIEASSFIPGVSEFPSDNNVREALSSILENTALFSEIIIRYPDIAVDVLKTNNNWDVLLQWGIAFSNQMRYLLDKGTIKLLHLVSQELNHIDKDPNYVNPYRKIKPTQDANETEIHKTQKKAKKIKKGPRMIIHNEL